MPYQFEPGKMYRMPTHFGPSLGPRQGPGGRKFSCLGNPKTTSVSVSFLSDRNQLNGLLPAGFEVGERPIVTVTASYIKEIEWLAGRGYNTLGVTIPALFKGDLDSARGPFLTVLWENLADPIITGREDIGFAKIYCELPEPSVCQGRIRCTAGWLGFKFLDLQLDDLGDPTESGPTEPVDGMLHYKYIPKTQFWGEADLHYAVLTPSEAPHRKVIEHQVGRGSVIFHRADWEDLPTFYTVVNAFANLEVKEYLGGSVTRTVGGKDLSDQRILR
ncbi:MAG: acetoacetate decarboxylase family protein [Boseongicola sp.]|nr:acetoacetate decarboxylase family protein [Boseongicola sp.]